MLVVDDDMLIRSMLRKALERQGYEVIEAPNGSEAVELFLSQRPDMVLLDVLMPMMNGFEACAAMRRYDLEVRVPILMLTGLDDVSSVDMAFESGATDFITKPINWSLFTQRVRYALRSRNLDFALRKSQHRIHHALQVAKLGYWDWDLLNDRFSIPENVLQMLGIELSELSIQQLIAQVPADEIDLLTEAFNAVQQQGQGFVIEHRLMGTDHNERFVYHQCEVVIDNNGRPIQALGTLQDITQLKRAEDLILHQAYHDTLTDLPNQALYKERLVHALQVAESLQHQVAVISLDIDRFQLINDSLGHETGNELLVAFASFLSRFVKQGDTISRISGNEFAILLESMQSTDDISRVIMRIRGSLNSQAFELGDDKVYVTLSVGVAIYPDDDFDATNLMQHANTAMRRSKAQGGDQECFYTRNMNRRVHDRLRLENDLRHALDQRKLEIYYQPQVQVSTRKIIAMEALARWNHPQQGLISPVRFIPLAEETGLITVLGEYVLEQAICQTQAWRELGFELRVGINLSARQFMQDDLVEQVEKYLQQFSLPARYLDLEITETIAMQDAENSIQKMQQLKQLGVNLSMDDFGTGYSSLSYLHQFPLDVLKIDRSFVQDIAGRPDDGAIARAVIAMAQSLGLEVIAEGVENEVQYDFLQQQGCQIIQGYLISQPVTATAFQKLLTQSVRPGGD